MTSARWSCAEAEAFIAGREGRACVRLFRRADGTVLTAATVPSAFARPGSDWRGPSRLSPAWSWPCSAVRSSAAPSAGWRKARLKAPGRRLRPLDRPSAKIRAAVRRDLHTQSAARHADRRFGAGPRGDPATRADARAIAGNPAAPGAVSSRPAQAKIKPSVAKSAKSARLLVARLAPQRMAIAAMQQSAKLRERRPPTLKSFAANSASAATSDSGTGKRVRPDFSAAGDRGPQRNSPQAIAERFSAAAAPIHCLS